MAAGSLIAQIISASAQVDVLTYHNGLARTGLNTNEAILTPANVNSSHFGLWFTYPVDGQVYGQPLYVSSVAIPGQGTHNVVFVATEHNSVYAFDADSNAGPNNGLFWRARFGPTAPAPNNIWTRYGLYGDITPEIGITSTPVIDRASGTLYTDAFNWDGTNFSHHIHALNITNGAEQPYSPVLVTASVPGTGDGNSNGVVRFNAMLQMQRSALTLVGGILYAAYGSYGDTDPYHGWVIGYNATNLVQLTNYVFNVTPNGSEAGIWMAGCGLAVDAQTNLYFSTGNGTFDATNGIDYGDCYVKLTTATHLAVADYFSPSNQATLALNDQDIGSGGLLLLPDAVGSVAHPHLMVGCGKAGTIYLMDRDDLGHFNVSSDHIVQELPSAIGEAFCSPAYFNGRLYYQGGQDALKAFVFSGGSLSTSPASQSTNNVTTFHGTTPSVSANGTSNGIVWTIQTDTYTNNLPPGPAVLHAYNATNVALELYNSSQIPGRDTPGGAIKFTVPTIANGRVYVGGQNTLAVYANGTFVASPLISPTNRFSNAPVTISISEATPGASVYYTVDGSPPTTNANLYTGSFVLDHSALLQAKAFAPGGVPSATAKALFSIPAAIYEEAIVSNNAFAFWRFNENALFTVYDYFNPARDGAYALLTVPGVAGPRSPTFPGFENNNYAAQFGGNPSWVTIPPLNLNTNAVTITAWLYPFGSQASYTGIFMCRPANDASGFNYTSGNQLGYTWNNNSSATWSWRSGIVVPPNQWSLATLVVTPSAASVYLLNTNGFFGATNTLGHSSESFSTSSLIGDDLNDPTRAFNGIIDEVAVFKRALTPIQLQQLYNAVANYVVITSTFSSGNLSLLWPKGTLQQATVVTGPWSATSGATSPYIVPINQSATFYRVKVK
ncbi:MAG: LamG-like jellyroll fold domain-containing protein [Limisphaerales bacterium]